jgi:hypothetical protein
MTETLPGIATPWPLPKAGLDLQTVAYDAAHENLIFVRQAGLVAKVFDETDGAADAPSCTIAVGDDDELADVLATIARIRGRHDYASDWSDDENFTTARTTTNE